MSTKDHWNSGNRGPEEQRTRGTVSTDDHWNNEYRGPGEQWAQKTRGVVVAEEERNSGH